MVVVIVVVPDVLVVAPLVLVVVKVPDCVMV